MGSTKIKAAVVGCGRMGLHHVKAIGVCEDSELVGVVDPEVAIEAVQPSLPHGVKLYRDLDSLFAEQKPDVVHIVTPPATHAATARLALSHGAHVYVEKPFALAADEARAIVDFAQSRGLKVCAGHQVLFQHAGQHYRQYLPILRRIVHLESYFSFKTVRRVGGGLMSPVEQIVDILPHPIYLMLDALDAASPQTAATPCEMVALDIDAEGEVRALIKRGGIPAYLTVTLRGRPIESYLRIVGANGSLVVDFVLSGVTRLLGPGASAISAVFNPFIRARQIAFGTIANIYRMLRRKHKSYAGLAELIESFHRSIAAGAAAPVSPHAVVETVRLCELIGTRLEHAAEMAERAAAERLTRQEAQLPALRRERGVVLVTGGTGFLGRVLVEQLRNRGWQVRVPARRLPSALARVPGVEYVGADLGAPLPDAVFERVSVIAHLAAETYGGKEAHERNTIGATRLLLDAAVRHGIKRFIHTSSIAVLKPGTTGGGALREDSPVDSGNLGRGPYVWAKAEAERMVTEHCERHGIGHRQIRLGPLVDFSAFTPPGRLGREVGPLYVAMGLPGNSLSVCDVRTAADVIRHTIEAFDSVPPMLNLVEAQRLTRGDLVRMLRAARPDLKVMWLPLPILWMLSTLLKTVLRLRQPKKKPLDLYAAFAAEDYDNGLAVRVVSAARAESGSRPDLGSSATA